MKIPPLVFLLIGGFSALLAGCGMSHQDWARYYTGNNTRTFISFVPCTVDRFGSPITRSSATRKALKANNDEAGLILVGLPALLMVGMLFVGAGYSGSSSSDRQGGLKLSGAVMVVGCALLFVARTYWIEPPAVELRMPRILNQGG